MAVTQLLIQFKLSTIKRRPPITMAVTQQLMHFKSLSTIQRRPPITMAVTQQLMQFPKSFKENGQNVDLQMSFNYNKRQ